MHCPACGSPTLSDQQFCRTCGTGLTADEPVRLNSRLWSVVTLAICFAGVLLAVGGEMFVGKWLSFTGLIISLCGLFGLMLVSMLGETSKRKPNQSASQQPAELPKADTTSKLLPVGETDFVPSVTERTTNLLKTVAAKRSEPDP